MACVHVLKWGLAVSGKRMVRVLIKGVGEALMAGVMGVGSDKHIDSFVMGYLEAMLPAIGG